MAKDTKDSKTGKVKTINKKKITAVCSGKTYQPLKVKGKPETS